MGVYRWVKSKFFSQDSAGMLTSGSCNYLDSPDISAACRVSAFYSCARLLADCLSLCPLRVTSRQKTGALEDNYDHALWRLLNRRPNSRMSAVTLRRYLGWSLAVRGAAYCLIERDGSGKIKALWPIHPDKVTPQLSDDNEKYFFWVSKSDGTRDLLGQQHIMYFFGCLKDGALPLSPIQQATEALGIARNEQRCQTDNMKNGGRPGLALKLEGKLDKERRDALKEQLDGYTSGTSGKNIVLEQGTDLKPITLSPVDIQLLESRRFSIREICRFMRIPPAMIYEESQARGWNGTETECRGFVNFSLRPWSVLIEGEIEAQLLEKEPQTELEHNFDELLQGNFSDRIQALNVGVRGGVFTPNEARRMEKLPDRPEGDCLLVQQQMVSLGAPKKEDDNGQKNAAA